MKNNIKILISVLVLLFCAIFMAACAGNTTPYEDYGEAGYDVSVKYDANGGYFTTGVSVIVDTYDATKFPTNAKGEHELVLITPDDDIRDAQNSFLPSKSGYFLVGWYSERTPVKDAAGNVVSYTYSGRWDFDNDRLAVKPDAENDATTPALTLYAAWAPQFSYEFYDVKTGELLDTYEIDPVYVNSIKLPQWNESTGKLDMFQFPTVENKTFNKVYYDREGQNEVTGTTVKHSGNVNLENATAEGNVMKLYVDMLDGVWFNIYKAEHFIKNSRLDGNYVILADLDFDGLYWSNAFTYGEFSGTIIGNGHKMSNITSYQSDSSESYAGLFGSISADASIKDVVFENAVLNIETGSRRVDASFGLLTGSLASASSLDGVAVSGKIVITPTPLIDENTTIGLLCGMGDVTGFDLSGISCEALEPEDEYTSPISVTVNGNTVYVTVLDGE